MSTKIRNRQLNGSPLPTTGEMMDNPDMVMPSETLKQNHILPSASNTEVQPDTVPEVKSEPKAKAKAKKKRSAPPDTGHYVNYDNFGQAIQFVITFGTPPYNPPGTRLPLAQLQALYAAADLASQKLQESNETETAARHLRQTVFEAVPALGAQVGGQLAACGANKKTLKAFRTFMNDLTGRRAEAIDPTDGKKHKSASHTTFPNRIAAWSGIVTLCAGFAEYESDDPALTVAGLTDVKDAMVSSNADVQKAISGASKARIRRDKVFYAPTTGMVPVALDVKEYCKAIFGAKSPEFRLINHLRFRNLMGK